MIMYLAGPITGVKGYHAAFFEADAYLTGLGHTVLDPALLPEKLDDRDRLYMGIAMVDIADAVVLLPGWEDSCSACREWGYAMAQDKILIEYDKLVAAERRGKDDYPSVSFADSSPDKGSQGRGWWYVDGA